MPAFQIAALSLLIGFTALFISKISHAGVGTTVPISAELASSIAENLFPVAAKLRQGNLFLTEPEILFIDQKRIGIRARFQAYDHRPDEGIAVSEMGRTLITGELQFDNGTKEILLKNPKMDEIEFDRSNAATQSLHKALQAQWSLDVANPLRSELPPHPYILPFKDNIEDIFYDGKSISLKLYYRH